MSIKSVDLYALLSTAKKCHQKSCPEMDKGQNLDLAIENPLHNDAKTYLNFINSNLSLDKQLTMK